MSGYVLIVEKDAELQQRIGAALRDAGYELAAETEASWARRSIAVRRPDAVVLGTRLVRRRRVRPGRGAAPRSRDARPADRLRRQQPPRDQPPRRGTAAVRAGRVPADAARRARHPAHLAELAGATLVGDDETPAPVQVTEESLHDPAQQRERRDVERTAKTLVEDPVQAAFAGTLKRTPLARVLQRLYARASSGSLLLLRDNVKKIVVFADGYPFSVRSNLLGECLGQILLEKKLITGEVLSASVARMQKEKRQQGQILIEMGALSPYNLQRALVDQVEAKLLEVFSWTDGKFMFKAGEEMPAGTTRLERPPAALILEGIRRHYDEARQEAVLARYDGQYVALSDDPMLRLQEMTGRPDRTGLHSRARRHAPDGNDLSQRSSRRRSRSAKARLLLVALSEAGMIQPREATSRRRRRADTGARARRPGGLREAPAGAARQRRALHDAADGAHPGSLLGVGRRTRSLDRRD